MGIGYEGFEMCQFSNCFTTRNRSKLFDPNSQVHAIVFHGAELDFDDIKWFRSIRSQIPEHNQNIDPLLILFSMEPPQGSLRNTDLHNEVVQGFFNATITYRRDSDVYRPYGIFIEKSSKKPPKIWKNITKYHKISLKNRAKDIAWIVSHCETINLREKYAQELKDLNLLNVDIFGECGDQEILTNSIENAYETLAKEYKFYLSFENSNCLDYVTEKFYNPMKFGMIPIVLGGLSSQDYARIAPPNSYLHVDDFESPRELMNYLVKLSQDETLYNSYFWWRDHYEIESTFLQSNCNFCQFLNSKNFSSKNDYSKIGEFWSQCQEVENDPSWLQANLKNLVQTLPNKLKKLMFGS